MQDLIGDYGQIDSFIKKKVKICKSSTYGWKKMSESIEIGSAYWIDPLSGMGWRGTLNDIDNTFEHACVCENGVKRLYWTFSFSDEWDFNRDGTGAVRNFVVARVAGYESFCGWRSFLHKGSLSGVDYEHMVIPQLIIKTPPCSNNWGLSHCGQGKATRYQ